MCMSLVLLYQLLWQNPSQKNNMKKKTNINFSLSLTMQLLQEDMVAGE